MSAVMCAHDNYGYSLRNCQNCFPCTSRPIRILRGEQILCFSSCMQSYGVVVLLVRIMKVLGFLAYKYHFTCLTVLFIAKPI